MKPIIGITTESQFDSDNARSRGKITLNWNYFELVSRHGGVPIVIPPTADLDVIVPMLDGWLIPGGRDMDAQHFHEANHPAVELQDPSRWELESALFEKISPELPVLGICYGCQFLNVIQGGSLNQHLPDELGHDDHSAGRLQTYHVVKDSLLGQVIETDTISGKSFHHQGVRRLGRGVVATARHQDGTVEAIEIPDRGWTVAVQWHPERTENDPASQNLFDAFIHEAADFRSRKGS
jgi:putative glutamine amidotransferase